MIYIDKPNFIFRGLPYCHMATDTNIEELHLMATKLGLKRSWFQNKPGHPHYDLSPNKRTLALFYGAIEVSSIDLVRICFLKRDPKPPELMMPPEVSPEPSMHDR